VEAIEIRYAGVLLGRATQARDQGPAGLFIAYAEPLPVGTQIAVKTSEGEQAGRVTEVVESSDPTVAGMRVVYLNAGTQPAVAVPAPASLEGALAAAVEAAPVAAHPTDESRGSGPNSGDHSGPHGAAGPNGADHSGPHDGEHGGRRKRRRR
jgi:hypothetical protein